MKNEEKTLKINEFIVKRVTKCKIISTEEKKV